MIHSHHVSVDIMWRWSAITTWRRRQCKKLQHLQNDMTAHHCRPPTLWQIYHWHSWSSDHPYCHKSITDAIQTAHLVTCLPSTQSRPPTLSHVYHQHSSDHPPCHKSITDATQTTHLVTSLPSTQSRPPTLSHVYHQYCSDHPPCHKSIVDAVHIAWCCNNCRHVAMAVLDALFNLQQHNTTEVSRV